MNGEAGVPFFSISGSDFVEIVGGRLPRPTLRDGPENAPLSSLVDEIDAVGRQRGAGLAVGMTKGNQLLVAMDGFEPNSRSPGSHEPPGCSGLALPGPAARPAGGPGYPDIKAGGDPEGPRQGETDEPEGAGCGLEHHRGDLANTLNEAAMWRPGRTGGPSRWLIVKKPLSG